MVDPNTPLRHDLGVITIAAGSASFVAAYMLVVSLVFLCFGVFFLSARGSAWARKRVEEQRPRELETGLISMAWARGHEARLTRFLAIVWVVAGSVFALVCIAVLALG
ncbi:hypothetical protein OG830_30885 [Streptomyces sp. NBC_00121]|uniref:hypothetical protein n=1 Tax=unclassified Streptomyces TaxID=2593676 RepID=UPI0028C476F0|nr:MULTISPECIES: hypothetical protein [unclassified Streptomyces]WNO67990.1 hypothetical protein RPQ02_31315 [Streptomyces sp. AM2-3-1]WSC72656.1 hypothetical protein OG807_31545 [Streptomyces sp. NBC_01760]WTI90388.1 hypothetical protein OHB17_31505 [Streptomyces sp. NBC_00724]